jgi:murein DD-endopeptidase MepM/ murein hydrolase activator NlpD
LTLLAEIDPAASDKPRASAGAQAHVPPHLPPIILYGSGRATPIPEVRAYADPSPPLTSLTPGVSDDADLERSRASRPPVVDPTDVKPIDTTAVPRALAAPEVERRFLVARPGDTLSAILAALGTTGGDAQAILTALAERDGFGRSPLAGGEALTVLQEVAQSGAPRGPLLKISVERSRGEPLAIARTDDGAYRWAVARQAAKASQPHAPVVPEGSSMTLRASLHALVRAHRVKEAVVAELLELSGRDFDLDRPLGAADEAELIYAPSKLDPPELVYAALTAQGRSRGYYRFTSPDDGGADFYDGDGRSATKLLLHKPVFAGSLGDGFGWRIHPILHDLRFHEGVDYPAPFGSPIAAAGEGVVEQIAEQWGYGEYIRIRHDLGYETTYAHLAGIPHGVKVTVSVRESRLPSWARRACRPARIFTTRSGSMDATSIRCASSSRPDASSAAICFSGSSATSASSRILPTRPSRRKSMESVESDQTVRLERQLIIEFINNPYHAANKYCRPRALRRNGESRCFPSHRDAHRGQSLRLQYVDSR